MFVARKAWFLIVLFSLVLLSSCVQQQASESQHSSQFKSAIKTRPTQQPAPIPPILLPPQQITPTATPTQAVTTGKSVGPAPYGPPPTMTNEELQLTQQLFALINSDRASHGLFAYSWNSTLAGGARLHSWNMYHCGFSHTCPDGTPQCTRIADEGFAHAANAADCGENIGYAGPYPTPWQGVKNIQEDMVNEPPTGWHRIHLLSTTLHMVGVGVYVDPTGFIWFTEDLVS
jgi:uncharacterized protein YkwD